jgi:predicted dehydrogenase
MSYQREFVKKINIGIVGVGRHCYRNIIPALHYLPVNLKAVCDINEDLARLTAAQFGCKAYGRAADMYEQENLDAVLLVVSEKLHPQLAKEAFAAGLHVWMEKPAAVRAHQVEEMMEHRKDRICVVGFKKAFMPSTLKAIEIANSPDYGELWSMLAIYPMSIPENGREILDTYSSANWLKNGCHPLSQMLAVGGPVASVITHRDKRGRGMCLLEFVSGVTGNFHFASGPHPSETYRFYGENWHLAIDNSLRVTLQRGIPYDYNRTNNYVPEGDDTGAVVWEPQNCLATLENKALFTQGFFGSMEHFCNSVLAGQPAQRGSLEFALGLMKVYEATLISNGKQIEIQ